MTKVYAKEFYELCRDYKLLNAAKPIKDSRSSPRITTNQVINALTVAPALGFNSLMDVDHFTHKPEAHKIGVAPMSDSLIQSLVPSIPLETAQGLLDNVYINARNKGLCKLELTNQVKPQVQVSHVDGTYFMTHYWVFQSTCGNANLVKRIKWIANIGEELKGAQNMIRADLKANLLNFDDIITFDGKHVDYDFLRELKGYNVDFLVRIKGTDGRNLNVVKHTQCRIENPDADVSCHQGTEIAMNCSYKLWRVGNIYEPHYGKNLVGLKVELKYFKGPRRGQTETHYGICSADYLNAQDLWILRRSHWVGVEILFRNLKRQFWSRHSYMKGTHEAQILAVFVCVSFNMLQIYRWQLATACKSRQIDIKQRLPRTLRQLCRELFHSLILWYSGILPD